MTRDLLDEAVWVLQECAPKEMLCGAFSGGKDSIALRRVCEIAGVTPEWHYHKTTIDPPELLRFIRSVFPETIWDRPKKGNFFARARKKGMLPSPKMRWCCQEYKESRGALNTTWITGERREESAARAKQPVVGLHVVRDVLSYAPLPIGTVSSCGTSSDRRSYRIHRSTTRDSRGSVVSGVPWQIGRTANGK